MGDKGADPNHIRLQRFQIKEISGEIIYLLAGQADQVTRAGFETQFFQPLQTASPVFIGRSRPEVSNKAREDVSCFSR